MFGIKLIYKRLEWYKEKYREKNIKNRFNCPNRPYSF